MASTQRWFVNKLPDFSGSAPVIVRETIVKTIDEHLNKIRTNQKTEASDCEGGIYLGIGGVAYSFTRLSRSPALQDQRSSLLQDAESFLNPALVKALAIRPEKRVMDYAAFLLGSAGVFATAALYYHSIGNQHEEDHMLKRYADVAKHVIPINFLSCGGDELLVGRAGYLSGILTLRKTLNKQVVSEETVQNIFDSMLESGREYSQRHNSESPLMYSYYNQEYLGAAHGVSGIVQMMLCFPQCFHKNRDAEKDLRGTVDYLLSLQQANGNFPCKSDDVNSRSSADELVHWCHGSPGIVYMMAKAYLTWKDERYLQSCLKCSEVVWEKGLLKKGPGTCHGVAGSGYVFLLLYRLTKNPQHLHRASMFADFMLTKEFKEEARIPDVPYSLYEGLSGTVCFLDDLLHPEDAHFPFFDIF